MKLMMEHNAEYMVCCSVMEKDEKPPLVRRTYSRIQSAKSGISNARAS